MTVSIQLKQICRSACLLLQVICLFQLAACSGQKPHVCDRAGSQLQTDRLSWGTCASRHCHRIAGALTKRGLVLAQEGQHVRIIVPSALLFNPQTVHFDNPTAENTLQSLKGLLYCYDVHTVRVASCLKLKKGSKYSAVLAREQAARIVRYLSARDLPAQLIYAVAQCPTGYTKAGASIEVSFDYDLLS